MPLEQGRRSSPLAAVLERLILASTGASEVTELQLDRVQAVCLVDTLAAA